ncbi:hypothetical protein GOBAR_AA07728 [Gossypium barbadense]|uniref:Uncharacterized protein n=1 Tax=Gossypium barbadense TaxID=3634 RepID=A0A2P5YBD5_GOSBA|nr:hypothetical protein GOBAR_AA07728 [Gossypium barbadense]
MTNYDDPSTVQFHLGRLVRQLSVLEFGTALGLYTEEFKEENELRALSRHRHFSPSKCWHTLAPSTTSYNPSRSKALVLPPSLRTYGLINLYDRRVSSSTLEPITLQNSSSRNSYHIGTKPPPGKVLHDCHVLLTDDHSYH